MEYIASERCDFGKGDYIDEYFVEKVLGEGTFGRVYRVKGNDGKTYALKLLKLWSVVAPERPNLMRRFDREYETGKIPSNYLVRSYSKGVAKNNPYIVMEFCPGGDLLDGIRNPSFNLSKVASEILFGLKDLHKCGKVHRDLKPENVLLRENGSAVLTDFGIAGDQNNRITQSDVWGTPKQLFGTYAYMPPEQVNPRKYGKMHAIVLPTTDIFSFGVMMYQMITGELPFGPLQSEADLLPYLGNSERGVWNKDKLHQFPSGKEWEKMISGCLIPNYKTRMQSVDDVLKTLPNKGNANVSGNTYKSVSSDLTRPQMDVVHGLLLRIMQGEEAGKVYKLDEMINSNRMIVTMGRQSPDVYNRIGIKEEDSSYVSRIHCTLEKNLDNNRWILRDGQWRYDCPIGLRDTHLNPCKICTAWCSEKVRSDYHWSWKHSMNGTYINSREVDEMGFYINPGDIITVGDVKLRVEGY